MAARISSLALTAVAALALTAWAAADARAASSGLDSARFSLAIDGVEIASFSQFEQVAPGRIVLRRGATTRSSSLWAWYEVGARKGATIVEYDFEGAPIKRYRLTNAWPSKLEIGGLKAGANEVAIESITLCHEGFEIR